MKTLKSKMIGAITGLAMLSGCAGLGAVYMQSDDPATRAWGTLMHNEGSHEQRMEEQREGRSEVNVNVGVPQNRQLERKEPTYKIIKIIDLDDNKERFNVINIKWPDHISYVKEISRVDGKFPEKGYKILRFESNSIEDIGMYIDDFKIIQEKINDQIIYKKVE